MADREEDEGVTSPMHIIAEKIAKFGLQATVIALIEESETEGEFYAKKIYIIN